MGTTFSEVLQTNYQENPDQVILTLLEQGGDEQQLSYRELIDGANAYANIYKESGLQPGEVVILILQHGRDLINAFWGAVLYGVIPSIMPFLTEKLLPERYRQGLSSLISITKPSAIVTYPDFREEIRSVLENGSSVRALILSDQISSPVPADFDNLPGMFCDPKDIVLLQHSSGTTGLQKGVALSHEAVFNQLNSYSKAIKLNKNDVIVSWLPLYHDMGLIAGFLMPILTGSHLVLMSPFEWVRAPYRLMQSISKYRGTLVWLPNFAYNFCAQKIRDRHLVDVDLSSWRAVINCSEPMRWDSQEIFLQRFAPYGLRAEAIQTCYAMAENVFAVTQGGVDAPVKIDFVNREALQTKKIALVTNKHDPSAVKMLSAGKPIEGTRVRVVDDHGNELPERHIGELIVCSNCMLTEYYHRPDVTKKAFLDGWYLTGDYGYIADGEVYITGRKKDLIIVGGKNIYPQDIEHLAMEVPGVHPGRVIAFGVFNEDAGTEDVVVVAEVDTDDPKGRQKISDQVRQVITRGSDVIPRHVFLVDRHWIVKTSSGKKARSATKDKYMKTLDNR